MTSQLVNDSVADIFGTRSSGFDDLQSGFQPSSNDTGSSSHHGDEASGSGSGHEGYPYSWGSYSGSTGGGVSSQQGMHDSCTGGDPAQRGSQAASEAQILLLTDGGSSGSDSDIDEEFDSMSNAPWNMDESDEDESPLDQGRQQLSVGEADWLAEIGSDSEQD